MAKHLGELGSSSNESQSTSLTGGGENMNKYIFFVTILMVVSFTSSIHAFRNAPEPVTPVIKDGIEYSAPQALMGLMGVIIAKDINTNDEVWRKKIYEEKYKSGREADVQWSYITHLAIEGEYLLIVNESWQRYKLNLKTHEVLPYGEVKRLYPAAENEQYIYALSTDGKLYAINSDGHQKWSFKLPGMSSSPPSLAKDGTIYASTSEALYAVNPDGVLKWDFTLPKNSISSFSIVGIDGTIYLGTESGMIYALYHDGKIKWQFNTRGKMLHPPAVANDGTVYASSLYEEGKGRVFAINKDGRKKWMLKIRVGESFNSIFTKDGIIYVSESYYRVFGISTEGKIKWQIEFNGGLVLAAGQDNNIFVADRWNRTLYRIKSDGSKETLLKTDGYRGLPSLSFGTDKTIYLANIEQSGTLYSISPAGSLKWKTNLNSTDFGYLPLAVDDNGTVYVGYRGKFYGTLTAIDSDGKKKWEFTTRE